MPISWEESKKRDDFRQARIDHIMCPICGKPNVRKRHIEHSDEDGLIGEEYLCSCGFCKSEWTVTRIGEEEETPKMRLE